ncbi:MAG TPA: Fic family protein [Candidatus Nanoarchaeia archaeon]|nr:Fic family protein [Candidatus Nanoarchaeia archaeon]
MHIEKRRIGGKVKYYLAHSYREGSKVHKFRKYLGQDTSKMTERKAIAEKLILEEIHKYRIIKDPLRFELTQKEVQDIQAVQKEIPIRISHLSWKVFSELFTYNTNAIEGSRLDQKEVKDILEKDKWPDKSKEDIAEAYGVDEALRFIRSNPTHISVKLVQKIHKIVFKNSKPFAGRFRKKGEEVCVMDGRRNIVHEGAPQARIRHLMNELVGWYEDKKSRYPALVLAAVVHNQFENIHPFADGNGRVGRILLNNILIKHGVAPVNIGFKNRAEYYAALKAYELDKDIKPTIKLFMKEYTNLHKKMKDSKRRKM